MAVRQGSLLAVHVSAHSAGLTRAHNAGATFLRLDSVAGFSPGGGVAVIKGYDDMGEITEEVTYGSVDMSTKFMLLVTPTVNAYPEGADVIGVGETTYATVDLEDGFEPIRAEISHALKTSTTLVEGIRSRSDIERVLIDEIAGRWMLIEVLGKRNLIDGGAIDPSTEIPPAAVPPAGPKAPPTGSPGAEVVPSSRSLNIYAIGPIDAWTTLVYEVSLDPGFATPLHSIRTRSGAITFAPTPDRTNMYVRITAENALGSADPGPVVGPVRTMLIESVDVADFGLTVKKFLSSTHQLY